MLLAPLSQNVFFASIFTASAVLVSFGLAEPVFGPLMESAAVQDWLRQVVVPLFM